MRIAGSGDRALVDEIKQSKGVSYLEYLDHAEVMRLVADSHLVIALYDPVRPINVMAAPNKLAEAFCAGRPVIINSEVLIGAEPEYQDAVIRTDYDDWRGLVEALDRLMESPDDYRRMCAAARRNYEMFYSWGAVVQATNEVFARVGF